MLVLVWITILILRVVSHWGCCGVLISPNISSITTTIRIRITQQQYQTIIILTITILTIYNNIDSNN